ncbi:hypothetical protein EV421DRAFT_1903742 [Armillaria borealis]|uniref:Uncharacterized protein n=1 Tax=Armillaria borealis TaxID=47425 RepID=A0AA39JIG0_9AGAR|nr:hypothetical protein EV421DRAFT_1903742 [Armillaria borealis]
MAAPPQALAAYVFAHLTELLPKDSDLGRQLGWYQLFQFLRLVHQVVPPTFALSEEYLEDNEVEFLASALDLSKSIVAECWLKFRPLVYLIPARNTTADDDHFWRHGVAHKVGAMRIPDKAPTCCDN